MKTKVSVSVNFLLGVFFFRLECDTLKSATTLCICICRADFMHSAARAAGDCQYDFALRMPAEVSEKYIAAAEAEDADAVRVGSPCFFYCLRLFPLTWLTHTGCICLWLIFPFEYGCCFTFISCFFIVSLKITKDSVFIFNAYLCISVAILCGVHTSIPTCSSVTVRFILLQQIESINGLLWFARWMGHIDPWRA